MSVNAEKLVEIRQKMKARIAELNGEIDGIEEEMKLIESAILDICKEQGTDGFKTKFGTVSRRISERYWSDDWVATGRYILEHGELGLLEQRIHQGNMKKWIAAHPDDFPPALNVDRKYTVTITKPRTKGDTDRSDIDE